MTRTTNLAMHIQPDTLTLSLHGVLDLRTTPDILDQLAHIPRPVPGRIEADLSGIERMDDCGALVVTGLRRLAAERGSLLVLRGIPDHVAELLAFLRLDEKPAPGPSPRPKPGLMTRFGMKTMHVMEEGVKHAVDIITGHLRAGVK